MHMSLLPVYSLHYTLCNTLPAVVYREDITEVITEAMAEEETDVHINVDISRHVNVWSIVTEEEVMGVTDSMVSTPLTTTTDVIMFINVSQREDMEVTVIITANTHLLTKLQQNCDNKNRLTTWNDYRHWEKTTPINDTTP